MRKADKKKFLKDIKTPNFDKEKLEKKGVPQEFTEILIKMLHIKKGNRPSFEEILKNELFQNLSSAELKNRPKLSKKRIKKLTKHFNMSKLKKLIHE